MPIQNPCEEEATPPAPRPPRRRRRGRRSRTAEETSSRPEITPNPEEPFAEAAPQVSLPQTSEETSPLTPQPEIQYVSATRDLTTIDENSFYQLAISQQLTERKLIGSSIWLSQKTNEEVVRQADRFRLAILNFWSFDGDSEIMVHRLIDDPRTGPVHRSFAGGDNSFFPQYVAISFHPFPPRGRNDLGGQYLKHTFGTPTPDYPYSTIENFPFIFNKDRFLRTQADMQANTKASHLMDIYLKGRESSEWSTGPRGTWWPFNPEKRNFYKGGNIDFGKQFQDYVFDAPAAFFESEMNNVLMSPSDSADIKVKAENHELHADIETELQVPNVYQYYQAKQITRLIDDSQLLVENLPPFEVAYNQMLISNYEEIENDLDFETESVLKFPSNKVETLEEINEALRGSLTNYVEIGINTTQAGYINSLLQRNRMDTIVMEFLTDDITYNHSREIERKLFTKVLDDQFISTDGEQNVNNTVNDKAIQNIEEDVFVGFDQQISAVPANTGRNTAGYFWPRELMEYPLYYTGWANQEMAKLEEAIRSQIFINQMDQHIEEAKLERSFADILYGRKAYSEVIGYKVEKYRINKEEDGTETEEKIQEFLLMDNDNISRINLLDTQILPGRKYIYKIFTINFVIGTKYEYVENMTQYSWAPGGSVDNVQNYHHSTATFNIGVRSGRSISLIYAPFFEKTVAISDKPPLSPQVSFLPHHGIDNKHSVLLEANYGEIEEIPVAIYPEDEGLVEESSRAQNKRPGSKILYKSDSLPTEFEMIRIENQPESYRDFSHDMAVRRRVPATGKTGFFIVDLEPNKYYYYIFRAYDKGGLSNPTEVFRVRIVSYQNGTFMEMEPYEMYVKPKDFKLSFERMLKIRPSVDQRIINFDQVFEEIEVEPQEDESSLSRLRKELGLKGPADTKSFQNTAPTKEKVSIGNVRQEDKVWDKNFKIRIKSKTTGKKIDLNVTFSNKKTTIAAEE